MNAAEQVSDDAARALRQLTGTARSRNGRLAIDWISRRQVPRYKMVLLDGVWYDRDDLRRVLSRRPRPEAVPSSRRPLTAGELAGVRDPNPWSLAPP